MLMQPEAFTSKSFDPISITGQSDASLRDGKAQPGLIRAIRSGEDRKIAIRRFDRVREYLLVGACRG